MSKNLNLSASEEYKAAQNKKIEEEKVQMELEAKIAEIEASELEKEVKRLRKEVDLVADKIVAVKSPGLSLQDLYQQIYQLAAKSEMCEKALRA